MGTIPFFVRAMVARARPIRNPPPPDPKYILRLLGQVITVSLETVKIVESLPELGLDAEE